MRVNSKRPLDRGMLVKLWGSLRSMKKKLFWHSLRVTSPKGAEVERGQRITRRSEKGEGQEAK